MSVVILFPNSFPFGGASTNRVYHIAKAIQNGGRNVDIICTRGTEKKKGSIVNINNKGTFNEVSYRYANDSVIWPDSILGKLFNSLKGLIITLRLLVLSKKKIDVVICYANYSFIQNLLFCICCKMIKSKFVYSVDEYPWSLINNTNSIYDRLYLRYFYKFFDGFIVMTEKLIEYYKTICRSDAIFVHVPMSVEFDRFNLKLKTNTEEYIAYCGGDKTGTKDGIDVLIKAFNMITNQYPAIKLYIIGIVHDSIKKLVCDFGLENKVVFYGYVAREKVPFFLINAKILCLSRPNNIQAEGGFPTKLGEYLASGVPVVVTNVGEISYYLKDDLNAFLVNQFDIESFASRLSYVLSNPLIGIRVGKKGRELALTEFDYLINSKRISDYLDEISCL